MNKTIIEICGGSANVYLSVDLGVALGTTKGELVAKLVLPVITELLEKDMPELMAEILCVPKAEEAIARWNLGKAYRPKSMFTELLTAGGLTQAQILVVLAAVGGVCHDCWDEDPGCRCWDDY